MGGTAVASLLGPRAIANTIDPPAVIRELLCQEFGTFCPDKDNKFGSRLVRGQHSIFQKRRGGRLFGDRSRELCVTS